MQNYYITNEPIDMNYWYNLTKNTEAGAVVIFSGEVRNHNNGKAVRELVYEAYRSMAEKSIEAILSQAIKQFQLSNASCVHRIGLLAISECAVIVVTSAAHRDKAYEANVYIIDRVKHEVPIWKNEIYEDGTSEWGNNCNCVNHEHHHEQFVKA